MKILLWGGKSKARIINEMILESGIGEVCIIFDKTLDALPFKSNALFINNIKELKKHIHLVSHYVTCIGGEHGFARFKTSEYLEKIGLKSIKIIHPHSFIEPSASVSDGCHIMPGAIIHKFSNIGKQTIINTHATIDHECEIGNGVHIMGNAAVAGQVKIDDYATIGTNATILPFIKIGLGAYVGAGAVVTKDVAPYSVVAGVPASPIKNHTLDFCSRTLEELLF